MTKSWKPGVIDRSGRWNEESLLRLVTAVLVELSDDWETGMKYLTI
ncbi:hypothetical protein [Gimesia sp.]